MDKGTKFDSGFTRSTMEAMGFATCKEGYRGFVRFFFLGNEFEIVRYRNCACMGVVLRVTSDSEFETYLVSGEELMEENPDVQGFFSPEECEYRIRIWGLDKVRKSLEDQVIRRVYSDVAPQFEAILSSGSRPLS